MGGVIAILFGLVIVLTSSRQARGIMRGQNRIGAHIQEADLPWLRVIVVIAGSAFILFGIADLLGWVRHK
jgi:hypothetical protein